MRFFIKDFYLFLKISFSHFSFLKDGFTPLFVAALKGCSQVVEILLEKGANINFFSKKGTTPLCVAAQNGHEQVVQLLLEKGRANVDLPREVHFIWEQF